MTESPAWHCNTVRCKMFNPNIFYLPVMPAQIYGRHILPKFRFSFMKNVNIQNSLLRVYSFICNLRVQKTVVELFMQGILIMRKKNILPHCDNVTGALKEQRGGSSKCLCGFQLPPKIWEEENKIFPQDLLQCTMYILSFT